MSKYLTSRKKVANKKAANSFYLVESYKSLDVDTLLHITYLYFSNTYFQWKIVIQLHFTYTTLVSHLCEDLKERVVQPFHVIIA